MQGPSRPFLLALAVLLVLLAAAPPASADPPLRVGTSGDYAPFSYETPDGGLEGFDLAVARAYARDRGLTLEVVRFRWPDLERDLMAGRFDVAMSGVTVRPERSTVGRFSVPVAEAGAVLMAREEERWTRLDAFNSRAVQIGVNAGGHLEQVTRRRFPLATLVAIADNHAVPLALAEAAVEAVVTDQLEAPTWQTQVPGTRVLGPFTRDRKAYLLRADAEALAADLDAWLLAREADGALAELRQAHLPTAAGPPVTTPLQALVAAIDERLALMPTVGAAKRDQGFPLEVPEREAYVIDAALEAVAAAAARSETPAPSGTAVRDFFRAQIEAAKQVQWDAVQDDDFSAPDPLPDVEQVLRPALIRIGEKIARLLVALPADLEADAVQRSVEAGLRAPYLKDDRRRDLARAVAGLADRLESRSTGSEPKASGGNGLAARDGAGGESGQDRQDQADAVAEGGETPAQDGNLPGDEAVQGQQ